MADNLPVVSGGGAVTVAGGGGAVAVSDQVGDLSTDRGPRGGASPSRGAANPGARTLEGNVQGAREAVFADWAKTVGANDDQLRKTQEWFVHPDTQARFDAARLSRDAVDKAAIVATLRKDWGKEYESNIARINQYLDSLPADMRAEILHARDAKGAAICNKPGFLRGLLGASRIPHNIPESWWGQSSSDAAGAELAELNAKMADRNSDYWKGPNAERNQARYRELVDQGVTASAARTPDDAVDRRIAELEGPKFMGNPRSEYFRGPNAEALQREYRDLIDRRNATRS